MIAKASITSDCVSMVTYNTWTHTMEVTFTRTHAVYEYYYIPFRVFKRLATANDHGDSPGRVYNDEIRGRVFTIETLSIEHKHHSE
jgi:hypothetical protein